MKARPKQLKGYLPLAFASIQANHGILNQNPLAGKASQKNDLSIAPIRLENGFCVFTHPTNSASTGRMILQSREYQLRGKLSTV
jgi:hypothetical protein